MRVRIVELDAFCEDVLWPLDEVRIDDEYERAVDDALERLTTTDETVMAALLNSPWATLAATGHEIKLGGRV